MDMINYVSSISSSVNEWLGDYRATGRLLSIDAGRRSSHAVHYPPKRTNSDGAKEAINHHSLQRGEKRQSD